MRRLHLELALAALALGLVSGCGQVIGLEDKPCQPGCTPGGEKLVCENGVPKTESCASTERCAAGECIAPVISALNCNACATDADGALWCWGAHFDGQLGSMELENYGAPVRVPLPDKVREVSVGTLHVCAVTDSHDLYCWGDNSKGQSDGGKASSPRVEPTRVLGDVDHVSAGLAHTCALSHGRVYCWGSNGAGQCGKRLEPPPALIPGPDLRCEFDDAVLAELGEAVQLPAVDVQQVVVQKHTTCALAESGKVYCWGANCGGNYKGDDCSTGGQLGVAPATLCYSDQPREVHGYLKGIGLGHLSGFAFDVENRLSAWGWGQEQLGVGEITKEFVPALTPVVNAEGEQLAGVNQIVRSNGWHAFAHTASGFFSWGENTCGELGRTGAAPGEKVLFPSAARADWVPPDVDRLATGQDFTCYLDADNQVYCFGNHRFLGQTLGAPPICVDEAAKNCGSPTEKVLVKLE